MSLFQLKNSIKSADRIQTLVIRHLDICSNNGPWLIPPSETQIAIKMKKHFASKRVSSNIIKHQGSLLSCLKPPWYPTEGRSVLDQILALLACFFDNTVYCTSNLKNFGVGLVASVEASNSIGLTSFAW